MKRSHVQRVGAPPIGGVSMAMADPAGFGLNGRAATCTEVRNSNLSGVRGSNRVSQWLFRMVALLAVLFNGSMFLSFANPVKYVGCTPSNGSNVTSWDFELQFDITKALEAAAVEKPNTEVGLGLVGSTSMNQYATLYEGEASSGNILGTALTAALNGKSPEFKVNGNSVKFSFDSNIPIKSGQKYTIEIKNDFYLYIKDKATRVNSTRLSYIDTPLVLTFYGGDLSGSSLFVESCSIDNNTLESLNEVSFTLNSSFNIVDGAKVLIKEGENEIGSTSQLSVDTDNDKQLKVRFSIPVVLYTGKTYTIQLPSGSLTLKGNTNVTNRAFETNVSGASSISYAVVDYSPKENQTFLPEKASITFDVPEGKTLVYTGNSVPFSGYSSCQIYPEGKENEATTLYAMTNKQQVTRNSFTWDLSNIAFIPSTKYYIKKEQGSTSLFDTSGNHCPEYRNEGITFSWTTPSIEEYGFPVIPASSYGSAKLGKHDDPSTPDFKNNGSYDYINTIEVEMLKNFEYNGIKYRAGLKPGTKWKLYDVTSGTRVFIKELECGAVQRETTYEYYPVNEIWVKSRFYKGHKYEIVLEENSKFIQAFSTLINYIRSEEVVFTVNGSAPTSVELISKTIADNSEVHELYRPVWVFSGEFEMKEGAKAVMTSQIGSGTQMTSYPPLTVAHQNGNTSLSLLFISAYDGSPTVYSMTTDLKITIPKGTLTYAGDETIANKEIVTPFKGVPKKVTSNAVNVSLSVNGVHTTSHKAVKDEPYTFALDHDSNWVVESVTHNGTALTGANETYTTEPLTLANNDIKANLKFAVEALVDGTTGVAELPDSNIAVTTDSDKHIVISGLVGNENLAIYSMNGLLVKDFAADGKNIYHVSVDSGIYIVLVVDADGNRKAAKVQVK